MWQSYLCCLTEVGVICSGTSLFLTISIFLIHVVIVEFGRSNQFVWLIHTLFVIFLAILFLRLKRVGWQCRCKETKARWTEPGWHFKHSSTEFHFPWACNCNKKFQARVLDGWRWLWQSLQRNHSSNRTGHKASIFSAMKTKLITSFCSLCLHVCLCSVLSSLTGSSSEATWPKWHAGQQGLSGWGFDVKSLEPWKSCQTHWLLCWWWSTSFGVWIHAWGFFREPSSW